MKASRVIFGMLLLGVCYTPGFAQEVQLHKDARSKRVVFITVPKAAASSSLQQSPPSSLQESFLEGKEDPIQSAARFLEQYGPAFGAAGRGMDLAFVRADEDALGMTHVSFRQRYYGFPVVGSLVSVHLGKDGAVASASVGSAEGIDAPTSPVITADQARRISIEAWQKDFHTDVLPVVSGNALVVFTQSLVENTGGNTSYLSFQVTLRAPDRSSILSDENYYVDTQTGAVVRKMSNVRRINRRVADCSLYPVTGYCESQLEGTPYGYPGYTFGR